MFDKSVNSSAETESSELASCLSDEENLMETTDDENNDEVMNTGTESVHVPSGSETVDNLGLQGPKDDSNDVAKAEVNDGKNNENKNRINSKLSRSGKVYKFTCDLCLYTFTQASNLKRHKRTMHNEEKKVV